MTDTSTATCQKFNAMREAIAGLRVRDKRAIFLLMRTAADKLTVDTFFPLQGFTAGEFAVGQVLAENNRKQNKLAVTEENQVKKPRRSATIAKNTSRQMK